MTATAERNNREIRAFSPEEIDLFLKGDRRDVDKLLLQSISNMIATFVDFRDHEFRPHATKEEAMSQALGSTEDVRRRREWLDLQIDKERERAALRRKVINASVLWAIPILLAASLGVMQAGIREKLASWLAPKPAAEAPKQNGDKGR